MPDDIRQLSADFLKDPVTVQIGIIAPAETVSHAIFPVTNGLKKPLLLEMLRKTSTGRVLIFTRTKRRARNLAGDLVKKGYNATALQGNMSQNRRQASINGFRDGKYDILVATDIAARGIDVTEISHVINFDMPDTVDAYTHRIGRTGRAEQSGEAFTFSVHDDEDMVRDIEKTLGEPLERRALDGFNYSGFSVNSQDPSVWAQPRGRGGYGGGQRNGQSGPQRNRRSGAPGGSSGGPGSDSSNNANRNRRRRRRYANPGRQG
jgi:ATP-dependent RNA helicase RhlE